MADLRISRKGIILGDFTLEQIIDGARTGNFLPSDDVLQKGNSSWTKLSNIESVEFPKSIVPSPLVECEALPRPPEYSGIYRSSDQNMLTGFCAGLAHRFGIHHGLARFVFVILFIITGSILFWVYWLSLLLPKLPTKDVA
jgi:phage shock protein PspC (stress-responsive transcriptional regulator)